MMIKKGDKIKTRYGRIEEVSNVFDGQIFTYENLLGWYHISKVWRVA